MKLWLVRRASMHYSTEDIAAIIEADTAALAIERLQQHMDQHGIAGFHEAQPPEEIEPYAGMVWVL